MRTTKTTEAQQPAEKTIKAANVEKIANELNGRLSERLGRLHTVLEDAAASNLKSFDDDIEHYNPYPALCVMALAASELESISEELFGMICLIRKLAA